MKQSASFRIEKDDSVDWTTRSDALLGSRLFSTAIIVSIMLVLVWLDYQLGTASYLDRPGLVFAALAVVLVAFASAELMEMWGSDRLRLNRWLGIFAAVVMVVVCCMPLLWRDYPVDCPIGKFGWSISGFVIAVVIVFFYEMVHFSRSPGREIAPQGDVTNRLAHYVFCFGYLVMLFGFLAPHRMIDNNNAIGLISIITLLATVKMSDAFAYFTGKSFGKKKIAPELSPKKTLEGALGSFFGAWIAAAIVLFVVAPYVFGIQVEKPWWWFLLYGVLITLAGMAGDLAESLLKRDANCKDSSKWLPGLGGILDVMDSLVFATPVSYFLWI